MKSGKKFLYLLFYTTMILIFGTVVFVYYRMMPFSIKETVGNGTYKHLEQVQGFMAENPYWQQFAFWASLVLLVISVIAFFLVLFRPKRLNAYIWRKKRNQLVLSHKAIEGFIASSLDTTDAMTDPKIKVNLTRRKMNVKIRGKVRRYQNVVDLEQKWMKQVEQDMTQFLGVKQKKAITLTITDTDRRAEKAARKAEAVKKSRVI